MFSASFQSINESELTAYWALYFGNEPQTGLYTRDGAGTFTTVAVQGEILVGGEALGLLSVRTPVVNDAGQLAFPARLNPTTDDLAAVFLVDSDGSREELLRQGESIGGQTISSIDTNLSINAQGQVAVAVEFFSPAIVTFDEAGAQVLAQGPLPSFGNVESMEVKAITDGGGVVFSATDFGSGDPQGLFLADTSGVVEIAAEGAALGLGEYLHHFGFFPSSEPAINASGQIAFPASIADASDDSLIADALFFYSVSGGLEEIVRTGDSLAGGLITGLSMQGNDAIFGTITSDLPEAAGINDVGQVAFFFEIDDATGGIGLWSPEASELIGDYNGDGFVSQADLDLVLLNWGETVVPAEWVAADQFDGVQVSQNELDGVLLNWGDGTPPTSTGLAAIPEPATAGLLLVGWGGLAFRRR